MPAPSYIPRRVLVGPDGNDLGTGGSALPVAMGAGENYLGRVGGTTAVASATPVVSTSPAYSVGDCVGGLMTFTPMARLTNGSGLVQMVEIACKSPQAAALDLVLFRASPTGSTFTDNAAIAVAAADFDKVLGVAHITDWTSLGTPSYAQADNLAKPFRAVALDLYGVLVARAVLTLLSTSDLKVSLKVLQD